MIAITTKICLEPSKLGQDYISNILQEIKKKYIGKCTREYGYIVEIDSDVKVNEDTSEILNCSSVLYEVTFNILENIKPNVGEIIPVKVLQMSSNGIVVCYEKLTSMKLFITISGCKKYKFNEDNKNFTLITPSKGAKVRSVLNVNDTLQFKFTKIIYDNLVYSCIGELV